MPEIQKYCTMPKIMGSCTIVQTCRGKQVEETVPYLVNIVRYLDVHLKMRFQELVGDFIKDESGVWWMINIKGFILTSDPLVNIKPITHYGDEELLRKLNDEMSSKQVKQDEYKKVKLCKYCETNFPVEELEHKMTLKMIIETDKHLLVR